MTSEETAKSRVMYALGILHNDYANLSDEDRAALRFIFSRWFGAWEFDEACGIAAQTLREGPRHG